MKRINYIAVAYIGIISVFNMLNFISVDIPERGMHVFVSLYYLSQSLLLSALCFSLADKTSLKASNLPEIALRKYRETRNILFVVGWYNIALSIFNIVVMFMKPNKASLVISDNVWSGLSAFSIFVLTIIILYGRFNKR